MNKLKGSSSAIKMKYLLSVFVVAILVTLPIRVYQLLAIVNTENGFYEGGDITVPVLYIVAFAFALIFMLLSFLSKEVPSPKLPTGKNPILGVSSLVMVAGLIVDIISIEGKVIPAIGSNFSMSMLKGLFLSNLHQNGGVFLVLQFVFAVLAVFYFLIFAISHLNGKASYKEFKLLALTPLCWAITMLVTKLMTAVSFISSSELLFEIFSLVFMMLFFLTFARISSGVFTEDSMWGIYGYGLTAAMFICLATIPRLISMAVGLEAVKGHEFNFAYLAVVIFIISYVIASLGVGFKDGLSNRRSISEVELPDDDEVVIKEDDSAEAVEEVPQEYFEDASNILDSQEDFSEKDIFVAKTNKAEEDFQKVMYEAPVVEEKPVAKKEIATEPQIKEQAEEVKKEAEEVKKEAEEVKKEAEEPKEEIVKEVTPLEEVPHEEEEPAIEKQILDNDYIEIPKIEEKDLIIEEKEEEKIEIPELSDEDIPAVNEKINEGEPEKAEEEDTFVAPSVDTVTEDKIEKFEASEVVETVSSKPKKKKKAKKPLFGRKSKKKEEDVQEEQADDLTPVSLADIRKNNE